MAMLLELQGSLSLNQEQLEMLAASGLVNIWREIFSSRENTMDDDFEQLEARIKISVKIDSGDRGALDHGRQLEAEVTYSDGQVVETRIVSQDKLALAVQEGLRLIGYKLWSAGILFWYDSNNGVTAIAYFIDHKPLKYAS